MKEPLSPETLRRLLDYDPHSGALTWRERPLDLARSERWRRQWNRRWAGKPALSAKLNGYSHGTVLCHRLLAHRVIWAMVHDEWPDQVDHINGERSDNRLCNLRSVDQSENSRNMKRPKNNRSGAVGVCRFGKYWRAYIRVDGQMIYLGDFTSFEGAFAARKNAEDKYGFHENHGREN